MTEPSGQLNAFELEKALARTFTPHAPVSNADLFAGRTAQIRAVADAANTVGLHSVIYGDRGVGKTSLTRIIGEVLGPDVGVARVSCGQSDSFGTAVRRGLDALVIAADRPVIGFGDREGRFIRRASDPLMPRVELSPGMVADLLIQLPPSCLLVFDEFDRLTRNQTSSFADLIKALSDSGASVTIVLVGVGESLDALLENHQSVERCIRQVKLQRMTDAELAEIVQKGYAVSGFHPESDAPVERIVALSQGFPHYTHLLALFSARVALDAARTTVTLADVQTALAFVVGNPDWDLDRRDTYLDAIRGSRKENLWASVVKACAEAVGDERGYFSSRAVLDELRPLITRSVRQQTIAHHLGKLTEADRGPMLERKGRPHQYRYRFVDPMMRPYILMRTAASHKVARAC